MELEAFAPLFFAGAGVAFVVFGGYMIFLTRRAGPSDLVRLRVVSADLEVGRSFSNPARSSRVVRPTYEIVDGPRRGEIVRSEFASTFASAKIGDIVSGRIDPQGRPIDDGMARGIGCLGMAFILGGATFTAVGVAIFVFL